VAGVRQKFDERWRDTITSLVVEGQEAGEFGPVDPADFAVALSALLDGFAIQIALEDPTVDAGRAYELTMRFAAMELGFTWVRHHGSGSRGGSRTPARARPGQARSAAARRRIGSRKAGVAAMAGGRIELVALTKALHRHRGGPGRSDRGQR
jgi:hypothetical protein